MSKVAAWFVGMALFAYSFSFAAPYSIPKLLVLSFGAVVLAIWGQANYSKVGRSAALLIGAVGLSALVGDKYLAVVGRYNSYALGLVGLCLAFVYLTHTSKDEEAIDILALVGAVLGVHALAQVVGFDSSLSSSLTGNRAIGTIGSPVHLGLILAMLLPIALDRSKVYAVSIALGLLATGSRGAWLAALVGVAISSKEARVAVFVAVLGAGVMIGRRSYSHADAQRTMTWRAAVSAAIQHPLLGVGPDNFEAAFRKYKPEGFGEEVSADAHNDLLQVMATCGLVGFAAYLYFLLSVGQSIHGVELGAIAALFVGVKFNPVPIEALVLGAVICGLGTDIKDMKPLPQWVLALPAVAVFALVCRVAVADYNAKDGSYAGLVKASAQNPYELSYKTRLLNAAVREANATESREGRALILNHARAQAAQAITLRPGDPVAWYVAGHEAKMEKSIGINRFPPMYFNRAIAMDPRNAELRRDAL